MKMTKRILAALLIAVMALSLAACGKEETVVGKWSMDIAAIAQMIGASEDEVKLIQETAGDMSATMEFTKDGKAILSMTAMGQTETQESTYKVENGKLVLDGDPADYKISKDTLTITQDGMTMNLKKVK